MGCEVVEVGKCLICGALISHFAEVCNDCYSLVRANRDRLSRLQSSLVWSDTEARPLIRFFDQFEARRAARRALVCKPFGTAERPLPAPEEE